MSKSLKNFIKITDAVERYGARGLRVCFLLSRYNAPSDFSEEAMDGAAGTERSFVQFFGDVKAALRTAVVDGPAKWGPYELEFSGLLESAKRQVRDALCDDLDTPVSRHFVHTSSPSLWSPSPFCCDLAPLMGLRQLCSSVD